ncbi:DUF4124 domain-containing protein [Arenimonas aestuarii]
MLAIVGPAGGQDITVYRCTDDQGRVMLQDEPCPPGQVQQQRSMAQPKDPPPRPAPPAPAPAPAPAETPREPTPVFFAPPPLYQCTSYDGDIRFSENYDPNPRCVPLAVLGYDAGAYGAVCRWVEDSCVRLDDASACDQFKKMLGQAKSDALHAFSDTAAYRKSEVERLTQIVRESCR